MQKSATQSRPPIPFEIARAFCQLLWMSSGAFVGKWGGGWFFKVDNQWVAIVKNTAQV